MTKQAIGDHAVAASSGVLRAPGGVPPEPNFSKAGRMKGAAPSVSACMRFNECNQYSDICVSIINLLLLVQLFGTELISRALYQSIDQFDYSHEKCRWLPSLAPSLLPDFPRGLASWTALLQEVVLHGAVIALAYMAPAAYVSTWRCPLMIVRRLVMPTTNLLMALVHEPSRALALELLGQNRLISTTVEVGLHTVMYPVPLLWHMLATTARVAIQAALVLRFAPVQRYDPLALALQLLASFIVPSILAFATQHTFLSAPPTPLPPPAPAAYPAAFPAKPPPPIVPRIVLPTAENGGAAAAAAAAPGAELSATDAATDATDAAAAAQRKQRRPPPRQRSLLAASETDSMVSPREAAAAAAAAAAGAAEVAVDAPRHSSRPPPRRQRSMYKPRIRPALLISVKMHHSPDINFDNLAPALRQSALKALHKYDCDSILAPGAPAPSTAGPSTSAAAAAAPPPAPTLSPLQVQSACIPGCVQLLIGAWALNDEGREGWLAQGQERGLAEALYRGVAESPEGRHLGRVVVQVGAVGFTFLDGRLVEEGAVREGDDEATATSSAEQCADSEDAGGPQWVWPAWVPEGSGEVEFACGSAAHQATVAGEAVRVVVAEGSAGRVLLDRGGITAGDDGIVRFTMAAPAHVASCRIFLLSPTGALLHSAPLLALPPECCAELDEMHACFLADDPTDGLLPLLPALTDLASGILATPPACPTPSPPASPADAAAAADAAATLTHLAEYFYENGMRSCVQLAATHAAHLQCLALTPSAPVPTPDDPHPTAAAAGVGNPTPVGNCAAPTPAAGPREATTTTPVPAPASSRKPCTTGAAEPSSPTAADSCKAAAPHNQLPQNPAAPPAPAPRLGTLWGFSDTSTKEEYLQYKAVHASRITDCLMAASCTISLAASVLFRSSLWQLWLAIDLLKVLQFALLLSAARPALWRWRDPIICATRACTALALAAATYSGWVPVANRSRLVVGVEAHVVMLVCGVLRPLLYQVSVSPAMLLAMAAEASYAALVYSPACGLATTATRCAFGSALGIAASLALDLRCRLHFLQLSRTLAAPPAGLHPALPACAATTAAPPPTALPAAKVKAC